MQRWSIAAAIGRCRAPALALLVSAVAGLASAQAEERLIEERSSNYNNIYVYQDGPHTIMRFGHNRRFFTESVYNTKDELELPVAYTRFMMVGLAYTGGLENLLEIGFGGGRTAWYLHKHVPALDITCVELDPVVVQLATKHFGVRAEDKFKITVADGRRYMTRSKETWDVIMIDAYRGPFVPFHLLTVEFFKVVQSKLKPGGVAVQNIEGSTMAFDSAIATMQKVFANIDIYAAGGNVVAVAYDGQRKTPEQLSARAAALQKEHRFRYLLPVFLPERRIVLDAVKAKVLTDDFAPVESLLAIERHNRKLDDISEPAGK